MPMARRFAITMTVAVAIQAGLLLRIQPMATSADSQPRALDPVDFAQESKILPAIATSTPGIPCYPSTSTSPVVKVFYLYDRGARNKLADRRLAIREAVGYADRMYALSAKRTGGVRHVRWLMGSGCTLSITAVAVDRGLGFNATRLYLIRKNLLKSTQKAAAFREGSPCMGLGDNAPDDRPGGSNRNNRGGTLAWVLINPCLDGARDLMDRQYAFASLGFGIAHELAHSLGAVQRSAPHSTAGGHCTDGHDVMCYVDGPGVRLRNVCPPTIPALFDCNNDDYFNTNPRAGSYLATHWNIARNRFLATKEPTKWDPLPRPGITFTSLGDGTTLDGGTQINLSTTDPTDGSTVAAVALIVGDKASGEEVVGLDRLAPFGLPFGAPWSQPGDEVTVRAVAYDTLGRQASTTSARVIVGAQQADAAIFAITSPPDDVFEFGEINVVVSFPTNSSLTSASIFLNGILAGKVSASEPALLIDPGMLGLGSGDLEIKAVAGDGSGLESVVHVVYVPG